MSGSYGTEPIGDVRTVEIELSTTETKKKKW